MCLPDPLEKMKDSNSGPHLCMPLSLPTQPTNVINFPFIRYTGTSAYNIYIKVDTIWQFQLRTFLVAKSSSPLSSYTEPQSFSRNSFEFSDPPSFSRRRFSCQALEFCSNVVASWSSCEIEERFSSTPLHLETADLCHDDI